MRRTKSAIANAISTIGSLEMAALLTFSLASITVSMWEEGTAFGDLDDDGHFDVVVSNLLAINVSPLYSRCAPANAMIRAIENLLPRFLTTIGRTASRRTSSSLHAQDPQSSWS